MAGLSRVVLLLGIHWGLLCLFLGLAFLLLQPIRRDLPHTFFVLLLAQAR
ncbi:hypothetical protein [Streptomyces sp. NPDC059783]